MRWRSAASLVALVAIGALALAMASCAPFGAPKALSEPEAPTVAEWQRARDDLAALRRASAVARTERVLITLREPLSGRELRARGAIAIAPPDRLRMILLGPGGTTALDLWINAYRYRLSIPAIDLVKRGDVREPSSSRRGLPVDFLRYWLLRPAEGALLSARETPLNQRFLLRDGDAIVELTREASGRVRATRSTWSSGHDRARIDEETIDATAITCGSARYHQASTGLDVSVVCDDERPGVANERAFEDPDRGGSP